MDIATPFNVITVIHEHPELYQAVLDEQARLLKEFEQQ
jgi:hypothetical protein